MSTTPTNKYDMCDDKRNFYEKMYACDIETCNEKDL